VLEKERGREKERGCQCVFYLSAKRAAAVAP